MLLKTLFMNKAFHLRTSKAQVPKAEKGFRKKIKLPVPSITLFKKPNSSSRKIKETLTVGKISLVKYHRMALHYPRGQMERGGVVACLTAI
jgi:hypothetical protein